MAPRPVTLITGFLGSGKSTLINRIIAHCSDRSFGLIVNEFGDVKLESSILEADEESIVELSNGCMCCVVRGDLVATVDTLLSRRPEIEHIILEASGLSDPVPIANTFLNADLEGSIRFDSIVCLLDLEQYRSTYHEYDIAAVQLEFADFIVLSKTANVAAEDIAEAQHFLVRADTQARVVRDDDPGVLGLIVDTLDADHTDIRELENAEHAHGHEEVTSLFFRAEQPIFADHFGAVFQSLPDGVVRAKGFLNLADEEAGGRKYILQYTGARKDLYSVEWRPDEQRQTAVVFIGREFDPEKLHARLTECVKPLQH